MDLSKTSVSLQDADMAVTQLTVTESRMKVVDFVNPGFRQAKLQILYRWEKEDRINILRLVEPFKWRVFLVLFAMIGVIPLSYYIMVELYVKQGHRHSIWDVYFYFLGSLSQQGGSLHPKSWTGRVLVFSFWLCSICLAASYSAYLTASLTVTNNAPPFTDVKGLLQRTDYKVGLSLLGATMTTLKNTKSGINKSLWDRIFRDSKSDPSLLEENETKHLERVLQGKYAVIALDTFVHNAVTTDCRLVYLITPVLEELFSFGIRKGSPYKEDFNKLMSRIVDSNVIQYYLKKIDLNVTGEPRLCETVSHLSVSTDYMIGILLLLGFGAGFAILALLLECLIAKIIKTVTLE